MEIGNKIAVNTLQTVAFGRKNWLFAGSDSGGKRAAVLYSLIGTCRLRGLLPLKTGLTSADCATTEAAFIHPRR